MGSLIDIPHGSSKDLILTHPTPAEKLVQFKLNAAEWRGALSLDAYLRREEVLSQQPLTQDGGITYWILVDRTAQSNLLDPTSSARLPLASCESYRKKALVWRDGKTQETITHGIGSVFCAPHLRGRKYAQRLMQEVGKALQTHQTSKEKECLFTVLFSDIGKVSGSIAFTIAVLTRVEILRKLRLGAVHLIARIDPSGRVKIRECGPFANRSTIVCRRPRGALPDR
jgi:hypothetical protein